MGYSTDFDGKFTINKKLDEKTLELLNGLASTRRVKRSGLPEKYGVDGEFYFNKGNFDNFGQDTEGDLGEVVDNNKPPRTQPGLWLQWVVGADKQSIEWDGGEKFYSYIEWIEYLIKKIFKPRGYILNGKVYWSGEEGGDLGLIEIVDNVVHIKEGRITYE
jgi:hypothetical protein